MKNSTLSRRSQTVSTVKQVAGDDLCGLLAQERPPCCARRPWGRVEPVAVECGADRGCCNAHAEALEFSLDALVAPAGVLLSQADDQLLEVLVECGAAWSTMRVGPGAGDQTAMPAQQRLRPDEEARPARSRQHATDGSK
jgi:hypothetical protein